MSKFCTKCGSQISDDGKFCPRCGKQCEPVIDPNSITAADTSSLNNSNETPENVESVKSVPKKTKKKLIVSLAIAVPVLAVIIAVGIIYTSHLFSSGRPSVVALDEDTAVFDLTLEEFKAGFGNTIDSMFKIITGDRDLASYVGVDVRLTADEYKAEFFDEDNWYSWEEEDSILHKWTYQHSDSFSHEILVQVDKESNKIKNISSTSYYPDTFTKIMLTSYIFYGYKDIGNSCESISNLSSFLRNTVEDSGYVLCIDGVNILSLENTDFYPTYYYFPSSESSTDSYQDITINLTHNDLERFDKALSARYGIDYEWQKIPNKK